MRFHFYSKPDEHGAYGRDGSLDIEAWDVDALKAGIIALDCVYGPCLVVSEDFATCIPFYRRHDITCLDANSIITVA